MAGPGDRRPLRRVRGRRRRAHRGPQPRGAHGRAGTGRRGGRWWRRRQRPHAAEQAAHVCRPPRTQPDVRAGRPASVPARVPAVPTPPPAPRARTADLSRITTVHPRTYNEARTIGEHFREGVPVIMNLSDMNDADAKRLVDFGAGLVFGLRGTIERVTSKVFLLSPEHVEVGGEDSEP